MCTAATYCTKDHYFGRNLDQAQSFDLSIAVTPRNFPIALRHKPTMDKHLAIIGTSYVVGDLPLYYDATNENGLSIAGLLFPDNAHFFPATEGKDNVCEWELIPWILGQCTTIDDVKALCTKLNITNDNFSDQLQLSPMHWMISDRERSVVIESVEDGLHLYDNPFEVLTNNPPFPYHLINMNNYMNLTSDIPTNRFSPKLDLKEYSFGFGGIGLPGDISSSSRFVRACFTKFNLVSGDSEAESVAQFFHLLGNERQVHGLARVEGGYETTIYSSCCNTDKGIYYYTTNENSQVSGVNMHKEDLDAAKPVVYPMLKELNIKMQN